MTFIQHTPKRLAQIIGALLIVAPLAAQAGYTVMDDDLFPTNAVPASVAAAQAARTQRTTTPAAPAPQAAPVRPASQISPATYTAAYAALNTLAPVADESGETYTLLFRKGIWGLNEEGANAAADLLPLMIDKKIIITGRPDTTANKYLADQRATYMKNWYIRQGVPATQIEIRTKDVPTIPVNGQHPIDIQIVGTQPTPAAMRPQLAPQPAPIMAPAVPTRAPAPVRVADSGIRTTITPLGIAPQAAPATNTVAIIATPPADARIDMIRQIAQASQAGRIDPKAALATILEILSNPSATTPQAAKPAPGAEFGLEATPETARPKEWALSKDKTLKDNATEWAKVDGYDIDWRATNYFKVGRTQTLTGDLLATIDRVTTAAGLDMGVWKKDRLIRICDKGDTACKPQASR